MSLDKYTPKRKKDEDKGLVKVQKIKVGLVWVDVLTDGCALFLKCPKCGMYFVTIEDLKAHWRNWCSSKSVEETRGSSNHK